MRALVVSNMLPDATHPERGRFVRDQVRELASLPGLDVELFEFEPGGRALLAALARLRRRPRRGPLAFDFVHAHFSLSALPALGVAAAARGLTLHGTDVIHPRTRQITRALMPAIDLLVAVSRPLAERLPGAAARRRAIIVPCGVDVERFKPIARAAARTSLGLPVDGPQLLFPADPARAGKRHDLAAALAAAAGVPLLTLGGVEPERVPLFVNAANAVLVPSDTEGFGLAALEALACEVPVLATPVGIHPAALAGIEGTLCAPFGLEAWLAALQAPLREADPRVRGRQRAAEFSARTMAAELAQAWQQTLERARSGRRTLVAPRRTG
jgi:teichuronic acid biosynthesis glycosyltransferase TuaC